jgi:hypothetical protein
VVVVWGWWWWVGNSPKTVLTCLHRTGSLTITRGNGGDVVNGTGQVQSGMASPLSGLLMLGSSHLVVGGGKGAITLTGGRGGNVDAGMTVIPHSV